MESAFTTRDNSGANEGSATVEMKPLPHGQLFNEKWTDRAGVAALLIAGLAFSASFYLGGDRGRDEAAGILSGISNPFSWFAILGFYWVFREPKVGLRCPFCGHRNRFPRQRGGVMNCRSCKARFRDFAYVTTIRRHSAQS